MSGCGDNCLEIVDLAIRVLEDPLASDADLDEVSRHIAGCPACHDSIDCYSRTGMLAMRIPTLTSESTLEWYTRVEITCHSERAPESLVAWMQAKAFAVPKIVGKRKKASRSALMRDESGTVSPWE